MQKDLFDYVAGSNVTATSKQALKELTKETISLRYKEYMDALWDMGHPATDVEVSSYSGHPDPNYFRPRRFELENFHRLIFECKTRQCSVTKRMAKTFWFTDKGLEMIGGENGDRGRNRT